MKAKSIFKLVFIILIAVALWLVCYFGISINGNEIMGIGNIKLGLDLKGGATIVFQADKEEPTQEEMDSAISLMQERLDRKNYTEAEISQQGSNRIRIDIPGFDNAQEAAESIGQTALLTFQDENGNVLLTGSDVEKAYKGVQDMSTQGGSASEPIVVLEFTPEGADAFAKATADNVGKPIYIMLDGEVISAPYVSKPIEDGQAIIQGNFTPETAGELANLINSGSLPFALEIVSLQNVGARLGADALHASLVGGSVGFAIILLLMIFLYKVAGFAADLALFIYLGMEILVLSIFGVTLSLPGIAGIVLSIGMAVDANIIIFERIKDELQMGKSLRASCDIGFKRALPAIVDSNVTTIIAGIILFWLGTGAVKGFAQTLVIGIVLSMFTAIFVTKIIIKSLIGSGIMNPKYYGGKKSI